ncbi:MAG: alpha-galactosidase [Spirochaetes bacterium]|nr:alpha-galactosidase [Spirochaetota bacterium]
MFIKNKKKDKETRKYDILWDEADFLPSIQLKFGIKRKLYPLTKQFTNKRETIYYVNKYIELKGKWENFPDLGSKLSLKLKNITDSSIRLARLVFPAENGFDKFLKFSDIENFSFLRNGYQSWSTSRSYKIKDKPLRPWLQLVSLASSNMANLPSNTPGLLSSDMFSIICDLETNKSFLIGQADPFDQFFYIKLYFFKKKSEKINYFEILFDFGRKMIMPGETIKLDSIIFAFGETNELLRNYFSFINMQMNIDIPEKNIRGWSSWYCFNNKVTFENITANLNIIKKRDFKFDCIQLDDGYQKYVGDWLDLTRNFDGRMKELADNITKAGLKPGIWIAPFAADIKSELVKIHPEYILRNEFGHPLTGGFNPDWHGKLFYGLDITNPRFEEYLRKVIKILVHEWGFKLLKLDFLYAGCLRGGTHHNLNFSRAEVLKYGINVIKEEAGEDTIIIGCGMPITTGIGMVDIMRVGPDTASVWKKFSGSFLQTASMIGTRNSIRNFIVRSCMNKFLWINDPDCIMIREKKTKLTKSQRITQINAIILSGGNLFYSDDLTGLSDFELDLIYKINELNNQCYKGFSIPVDLMYKELPEIYYNTVGYLAVFNFKNYKVDKLINLEKELCMAGKVKKIIDVWTEDEQIIKNNKLELKKMPPFHSRLFKIINE